MSNVLAREGAPELLTVILIALDIWRGLTKPQRATLLYPNQPAAKVTIAALTRKGLWDTDGITTRGRAVVRYAGGAA